MQVLLACCVFKRILLTSALGTVLVRMDKGSTSKRDFES